MKWGGNSDSMYAGCTVCGLKTCIMYKKNRAFVTDAEAETNGVHLVELSPGLVMIDTGCRAAVGGRNGHQGLQGRLKELGKKFYCAKQLEFFQFGPGDPIRSTRRWHYQVGVQGVNRELVMSEVPVDCPGLIGPEKLAAWTVLLDFGAKTFTTAAGVATPIIFARSGHPCMSLLAYEEKPKEVYQMDLHSEDQDGGSDLESLLERTNPKVELHSIAEEDLDLDSSTSEESSHAWTTEAEQSDDETEEDAELGVFTTQQKDHPENLKFMSKGDYRHVRSAVKNIQECMIEEKKVQNLKKSIPGRGKIEKPLSAAAAGERRPGPWRFLEIFTWTCAITMAAHQRGWETYEPITLPGWNLDLPEVRAKARAYIEEVDPDFIMIAPPCGPWSQIQIINQRTPMQIRNLQRKRFDALELLLFVEEVVHFQHCRGRAVAVENPKTSLLWQQAPMRSVVDLPGMSAAEVDMCAYEKRRPDTQELIKKPTLFGGTKQVCETVGVQCAGGHEHGSAMGSWVGPPGLGPTGAKLTLSEWAGGYTEQLANKILDGAEKYLGGRRCATVNFPVLDPAEEPHLAEENSMDADDTVQQDDWSSNELPEMLREELYQKTPKETRRAIRKAHCGLGHPSRSTFVRMLRLGGATPGVCESLDLPSVCRVRRTPETSSGLRKDETFWIQQDCLLGLEVPQGRSRAKPRGSFGRGQWHQLACCLLVESQEVRPRREEDAGDLVCALWCPGASCS